MHLSVTGDRIAIRGLPFGDSGRVRELANARWHSADKFWSAPATPAVALHMIDLFRGRDIDADGMAWADLAIKAGAIRAAQWAKTAPETDLPSPRITPIVDSWLHQKRAVTFASALEASMLAFYMGRGKTKAAIDLMRNRGCKRVLISCPANVMRVWTRELARHGPEYEPLVLPRTMTVAKRMALAGLHLSAAKAAGKPMAVIVNHEALWREPFAAWIKDDVRPFDHFVMDESHRGKQHNGALGNFIKDLWKFIPSRMALTGTPYPHSMMDIFAQFRMLDPGVFGTSWTRFKERYAVMGGFQGKNVVGVQNLEELQAKFEMLAYYVEDDENLPELIETFRSFALTAEARKIYKTLERDLFVALKNGEIIAGNVLVKLLRLQQITSGYCRMSDGVTDVFVGEEKIKLLADLLENELPKPAIVFCRFREDLDRIRDLCQKTELRYGEVSGRQSDLTDDATMPEWADVFGVQIQAGGVGIDLTRARVAVFYSVDYRLDNYKQCIKRLHRQGQEHAVTIVHLTADDTVDEDIYDALTKRAELVETILGRCAHGV